MEEKEIIRKKERRDAKREKGAGSRGKSEERRKKNRRNDTTQTEKHECVDSPQPTAHNHETAVDRATRLEHALEAFEDIDEGARFLMSVVPMWCREWSFFFFSRSWE